MKKIILALTLFLAVTSAVSQDVFAKKNLFARFEPAIEINQVINDNHTIGKYPLLQFKEKQRTILVKVNYSTGVSIPLGRLVTFSEKEKKLLYAVDTNVNLEQGPASDWTDTPCKREDYLWKRAVGGEYKNINCTTINHIVNYFVKPTGDFQQLAVFAKDQNIEIPPTIIRVTFTRYSDGGRRLVYVVDINPEQYGVERDATPVWGSNGWYKDFLNRDPNKVEFIDKVRSWAIAVQDRMEIAFKQGSNAFLGLNALDDYLNNEVKK